MPVAEVEPVDWQVDLADRGPCRERALCRLHDLVLRSAYRELRYRAGLTAGVCAADVDDLAHQSADDAMMAILGKIDEFRGESRFTTWAYAFVVFEVSVKLRRHARYRSTTPVSRYPDDYDDLPDQLGSEPYDYVERQGIASAVGRAVDTVLSSRQRQVFVAVAVTGVPLEVLGAQLGISRNAIHQTMFDVRRKLRVALQAEGYLAD